MRVLRWVAGRRSLAISSGHTLSVEYALIEVPVNSRGEEKFARSTPNGHHIRGRRPACESKSKHGSRDQCRGQSWRCDDQVVRPIQSRREAARRAARTCSWSEELGLLAPVKGASSGPHRARPEDCTRARRCAGPDPWNAIDSRNVWRSTRKQERVQRADRLNRLPGGTSESTLNTPKRSQNAIVAEYSTPSDNDCRLAIRTELPCRM